MKENNKKLKLVIIERDKNGNQIGKTEIPVNNEKHTIVNSVYNKPDYSYRRTFDSIIRDNQRKNNIVQKQDKMNITR